MSYVIELRPLAHLTLEQHGHRDRCSCKDAQQACRPPYVFSISGQVGFRQALAHLISCRSRSCQKLRRAVRDGMSQKLTWLMEQNAWLGCATVQTFLYAQQQVRVTTSAFSETARHLSRCPHESCAQLRRSLLLTVRSLVGEQM
jgi:hypothetical protein